MPNNPDDRPPRYGAHVYSVEALDLSAHGMPGFAFTGDLHVEPDDTPGVLDWYIAAITEPGGAPVTPPQAHTIYRAVMADKRLCDFITDECLRHGEG